MNRVVAAAFALVSVLMLVACGGGRSTVDVTAGAGSGYHLGATEERFTASDGRDGAVMRRWSAQPPVPAVQVVRFLARQGVACPQLRRASPSYEGELSEAHCRGYALATFAGVKDRADWYQRRRHEPWFPARWLVVAPRWAAWMSDPGTAAAVARAGHGRRLRLRLPAAFAHVTRLCDDSFSTCRLPIAHPVPASPKGYVYSFDSEVWDSGSTNTATGLRVVSSSDSSTAALTGIVETSRGPPASRGPIAGLRLTLRSTDPRLPPVRVSTTSDRWGGFAFTNVPATSEGSCYLITAHARTLITIVYAALFEPGQQSQATWDVYSSPVIRESDDETCFLPAAPGD